MAQPVAADDVVTLLGAPLTVDLAADNGAGPDRDQDGDILTLASLNGVALTPGQSTTLPSGIVATFLGGARVTFAAPAAGDAAVLRDVIAYTISDGRGGSASATVDVASVTLARDPGALDGASGFRIDGVAAGDLSGAAVSAGDLNGDGIGDLIVGAFGADPGGRSDAGAAYVVFGRRGGFDAAIPLSALDGSGGFRLDGVAVGDQAGFSVSGAGDVNGDGIDDLILGAPNADPGARTRAGAAFVLFGRSSGFDASVNLGALDGTTGFRLAGANAYDSAGVSVSGAGDVNGDGIDDLIIGANLADPGGRDGAGAAFVVFGRASGFAATLNLANLNGTNGFRLNGVAADDNAGFAVSGAGDVNGDGIDDLIVGADAADPTGRTDAGATYVVFGRSASGFGASLDLGALDGATGFRLDGAASGDVSGVAVASAGDVNGDGIGDLIVGATLADPGGRVGAGAAFVVFGRASGFGASLDLGALDGATGFRLDGAASGDASGVSVASAGDVNGDGFDDLIVGAYDAAPGGRVGAGSVFVVFGRAAGFGASLDLGALDGATGFRIDGVSSGDGAGISVASAGDVNGDGIGDLILGANLAGPGGRAGAGSSYVIFGSTDLGGAGVGTAGNDALVGGRFADRLFGRLGADALSGLGGRDRLEGSQGADTLDGGAGVDTMIGGAGNDVYVVDDADDVTTEEAAAAGGRDIVRSSVSRTLGVGLEALILTGAEALSGTGNGLANALTGNAAANVLRGGRGADTLDGGAGADRMVGGAGNDLYLLDSARDVIVETARPGGGVDTARAGFSLTLASGVESVVLTGRAALQATGNGLDNALTGNRGANVLRGGLGDDTLDGRGGADRMIGGAGDDVYVVNAGRDATVEVAGAAGGVDTVRSSVDRTLGAGLENLALLGARAIDGAGNGADNLITGNRGANLLRGLAGDDTLSGGLGPDRLQGGGGEDTFRFVRAAESAPGARDTILGFAGAGAPGGDVIDLSEIDTRPGTARDDAFVFDSAGLRGLRLVDSGANTLVLGNLDRDAAPEIAILIRDGAVRARDYDADDFLL